MDTKKVTKQDLVDAVYLNSDCERRIVQEVVEQVFIQLKDSIKNGRTVELRSFGTFESRLRKGRVKARNPRTGETLSVPPHYVAIFKPGQEIRSALLEMPVESAK